MALRNREQLLRELEEALGEFPPPIPVSIPRQVFRAGIPIRPEATMFQPDMIRPTTKAPQISEASQIPDYLSQLLQRRLQQELQPPALLQTLGKGLYTFGTGQLPPAPQRTLSNAILGQYAKSMLTKEFTRGGYDNPEDVPLQAGGQPIKSLKQDPVTGKWFAAYGPATSIWGMFPGMGSIPEMGGFTKPEDIDQADWDAATDEQKRILLQARGLLK